GLEMKKKIIWIGLFVVIIAIAAYSITASKQPITVDMGTVEKGNIEEYIEETAVVQLENEIAIYTTEGGKVLEIMAEIGQEIKAGDVLLRMDEESIKLQIKNLEAQKQSILAQYAGANEPASAAEIRKLNAQVKSVDVTFQEAKRIVENNKTLYESGAISMDAYQSSLTSLASAEAALEAAKSNLELAQNGVSGNLRKQYEAQLAGIQANIALLQKRRADLNVVSPINGIILTRNIEKGAIAQPGMLIFEVGDKSGMYLESDILVDDIANVKVGSIVLVENDDLGIKAVKGTVRQIYPKAFSKMSELGIQQKRVKVEIDFNEPITNLKSGYDMSIKIISSSKENTLLIDEKAIFEYQGKDHVFVNESGVAKLRAIEKGLESNGNIEVLTGLKEGEKIILSPDEKLSEGTKVK
ncbi:MAG: efflux transporter periplasmic adaptor subunit, partial [Clostridia bacterium]|nr:efflux transporter periplasmic adaptor subunit [Clostridia bacterium]